MIAPLHPQILFHYQEREQCGWNLEKNDNRATLQKKYNKYNPVTLRRKGHFLEKTGAGTGPRGYFFGKMGVGTSPRGYFLEGSFGIQGDDTTCRVVSRNALTRYTINPRKSQRTLLKTGTFLIVQASKNTRPNKDTHSEV
jgi:hypothetical protein